MSPFPADEGSPEFSPSPELSPGPINFYFQCKPEPGNEPEPGAEPTNELGIEPKPGIESEPEPGVEHEPEREPGLYLLSYPDWKHNDKEYWSIAAFSSAESSWDPEWNRAENAKSRPPTTVPRWAGENCFLWNG